MGFCLGISTQAASAAPLQRADVMNNPAWLLHLDCDALRPTVVGRYVLTEMDKPEARAKLAAFESLFSFDLRTQLHGVTLYGGTQLPQDGVLILYADFEPQRLVSLAKAAHDSQSSRHHHHTIYSWKDGNKKTPQAAEHRVYAAITGNRVLCGQNEATVAAALDVMDGLSPSLAASSAFADLGVSDPGRFVEGAARRMNMPEDAPGAAILKLSKTLELVAGEQNQKFKGTLTLTADSDDVAGRIFSVAEGIVAFMKLQADNPDGARLANALTITRNGSSVVGNLTLPANDAAEMMKADAARRAAARKSKEPGQ